jgi:ornithine carbamoyltransferase
MKRDFLTLADYKKEELQNIIEDAIKLKEKRKKGIYDKYLENKKAALLFEKPSTRTRISFEAGIVEMGGYPMVLSSKDLQLSRGESIKDTASIMSLFLDLIIIRAYEHKTLEEFARNSKVPVINALTDKFHPCQVLADFMTLYEIFGKLKDIKIAFIGDGNNVANSLAIASSIFGLKFSIATPRGYEIKRDILKLAKGLSNNFAFEEFNNPSEAVKDADVIYTDVWISMGNEETTEKRMLDFKRFMVNQSLMEKTGKKTYFMHCLPAHIGLEVDEKTLYSENSLIYKQAENRLHIQKAIISKLLQISI